VLAAFTYKGKDSVEMDRRRKRIEELRANNRRKRDANAIRSVYTRDGHAEAYDPALIETIVSTEMKFGDTIPSGTYLDMAVNLPLVDPTKVKAPVLMIRGEHDGNSTNDDLLDFYRQLPNGDRQFAILPNTAHSLGYSRNRHLLWYAVQNFLGAPPPIAAS
jgi:pimeloyl-ACP methyl ester carboxylesterase